MKRFIVGFIPLSFMVGLPTIAGRIACVLAAALLACASSAQGQVIEEGGFPVKGGGVSGEPFSLSCPPRLYVEAGESILFSCSATAVPEEGVRYEWESLSGDGLDLLSSSDELAPLFTAPLFTAPVSGEGAEYVYRLTAMSVGVYETATVTVIVGVSGGSLQDGSKSPESLAECDSLGALEGFREGCVAGDKMPPSFEPFEGGPEVEGGPGLLFPEAPGLPDRPSGPARSGGLGRQAPPRLECPSAVFLEELETGLVECHAWDASGEEYLEYSWEPVGNTTRDYLDNPRLIPEDSPHPSVVAPEAPVYETLESFHSGERTFRYRYRLTATSRATGLSSSSEVEVFVSSSRPGVYCPLEVVVEEGATIALDCEGADPLSGRMDYDEDGASILWEWEGLWGTSMVPLAATDLSSPLFTAPAGSAGEEYHYIASMTSSASGMPRTARRRVTVTVREAGEEAGISAIAESDVTAPARNGSVSGLQLSCENGIYRPFYSIPHYYYGVVETESDFVLDCEATGGPAGATYTYSWTAVNTDHFARLSATNIRNPTFMVRPVLSELGFVEHLYNLQVEASDGETTVTASVVVEVDVVGENISLITFTNRYVVDEGTDNFNMDIIVVRGTGEVTHSWRGSPEALARLSATDILTPEFDVPENVDADTDYNYVLSTGLHALTFVTVTVKNTGGSPTPVITCSDSSDVYEGAPDITLDCTVANEPAAATYSWTARGSTSDTNDLSSATILAPTFDVPSSVNTDTNYEYTVTMSASGIDDITEDVTVTVLEKPDITVMCEDSSYEVDEGDTDIELECEASGAPGGDPQYTWSWSPIDKLTGHDTATPTFAVPSDVERHTTYSYTATATAEDADDGTAVVTVKVRDLGLLACNDSEAYEATADFTLDCSVRNEPAGATYMWTARGSTTDTGLLVGGTDGPTPTFAVPVDIGEPSGADKHYYYTATIMVGGVEEEREDVTVTILEKPDISICGQRSYYGEAFEVSAGARVVLPYEDCPEGVRGAPAPNPVYTYAWSIYGSTPESALAYVPPSNMTAWGSIVFHAPADEVLSSTTFTYKLAVSAENADDAEYDFWAVVTPTLVKIAVACEESSYEVDEGAADFDLYCSASGAPGDDPDYTWSWLPTTNLTDHNTATPTFAVPDDVDQDTTYTYTVTATADNAEDGTAGVTVTVLDTDSTDPSITCNDADVYEGAADFTLDCSVTNEPSGATYAWTARGSTANTDDLSSTTILKPTFDMPPNVDADTDYDYTVTLSASGVDDVTEDVTVTVKKINELTCLRYGQVLDGYFYGINEGDMRGVVLDVCHEITGPGPFSYSWSNRLSILGGLDRLSNTNERSPTFTPPNDVETLISYGYSLEISSPNAKSLKVYAGIWIYDTNLTCQDSVVYEGSANFDLDCSIVVGPEATYPPPKYRYTWVARDDTPNTDLLIAGRGSLAPTFAVPDNVDADTDYKYRLTVIGNSGTLHEGDVTVTVKNKPSLTLVCISPPAVHEGSPDIAFDCSASGAPSGSDYDYVWTPRGATSNTDELSSTTIAKPTFNVPEEVDRDETYRYTLTASAENAEDASANVTVRVLNKEPLALICTPVAPVYEGSEDFALDCSASGAPSGSEYDYVWTARGATPNTDKLSSTTIEKPTFDVPEEVDADTDYEYTLTASAENAENGVANVTVRVLNKEPLSLICTPVAPVYEGSADFALDCSASGAPSGSTYDYVWTARGATPNTDKLSSTTVAKPTFDVPEEVASDTAYEYTLTVSAENAENGVANVTVRVLNKEPLSLICTPPTPVYEGSEDFALNCSASGAPSGSTYDYVWTARGATPNTGKLSSTTIAKPTFDVPEEVDRDETYEYTLTVSAENVESATEDVTVTVLNKEALDVVCATPSPVYEGSEDFALDCAATGAPAGSDYTYVWTGRGTTSNTDLLVSGTNGPTPTFDVPEEVDADTDYEYTLTASAENAENGVANVTVRVLNKEPLSLICTPVAPVYEGSADFALDCSASGAPSGSTYDYVWTARGATPNTDKLSSTTVAKPTFDVPEEVASDTAYEYTLTVSAENAENASANVTVRVLNKEPLSLICTPPTPVYEGSADFALDCSASGAPSGSEYDYVWTARGATPNTDKLSSTTVEKPTFYVPEEVAEDETYRYTLTASAENAEDASANVTVRVLNKAPLALICTPVAPVYEGSEDFDLDCVATGAPAGSDYAYVWTGRGTTSNTALLVSGTDGPTPTFDVPEEVAEDETYRYTLTASAENAEDASANVTVRVLNKEPLALICTPPTPVYEGSADFALDCSASGAPSGSTYDYVWTARGATPNTDKLSSTTIAKPTFDVPEEVDRDETYEYTLTVSADHAESATEDVTVTVLNKEALAVVCATPSPVYEGSEDFALDCAATGAPAGSDYTYVWTGRGTTSNTDLLVSGTDGPTPTFDVPEEVDEDKTYEYLLTVSAENATDATAEVTVTVLKLGSIALICASPPLVYEGSEDFALDCSVSGDTGDTDYTYEWRARGATANTDLLIAGTDGPTPTFAVPDALDETTTYEYFLTVSADNAEDGAAEVTVTVLNRGTLDVACTPPPLVYEGSADFALDCTASGAPVGSDYEYVWTGRGSTVNTDLLTSGTDSPTPTFAVPDALDETTTYEYLLTASAENAESGSAAVTVTVLNRGALSVVCVDPPSVYEGSADFDLDCSASGAPVGSDYEYVWAGRGSTVNTDLLTSGTDSPTPTFAVPDALDETTTYEYLLTASAENAESGSAAVTVTVLNRGALSVVCADPPSIYEGSEDFALDCSASGAPAGSEYAYAWTARGSTANTDLLIAGTDGPTPTFAVPEELDATTTYEYLLTASAENAESGSAAVTVTVLNVGALRVVCASPASVYEGSEDFDLDCSASGAPAGSDYAYVWTARGSTANTDILIAGTNGPTPTFSTPDEVEETTTYEYLLTASAENAESGSAEVTVTVLNRGALSVVCADPPSVYEGSEDFDLDCSASGAPAGSEYDYVWTAQGDTANTLQLSATDISSPTFYVPDEVDETTTYEYLLTASAENMEDATAEVMVTVLNRGALSVVCADPPSIYEGSEDFALDCSASGAPAGSDYAYVWTARGSTENTLQLSATDISSPTFYVPNEVDETTTYEYLLTVSADNVEDGTVAVTVTVLNRGALSVVCADPPSVYEGSEDFDLDCSASGAPAGSEYDYVWTAQGDTANTLQLSATDISSPTFYVPDEVDETTTYEYLLTASAENMEDATAEVMVTVLNRGALSVVCADPPSIYEGSEDFALDCSASGAPAGSDYAYVWTARGSTENTLQLSATDISSPTFYVPDEVDETTTYEYLLTASAENMEDATAEVMVTVLNRGALSVVCADPPSVYEGSEDFDLDCSASGAGGSEYDYVWTAQGDTANTLQLSATDISSPTFYVPNEVDETTTYKYLLTASADNVEDGTVAVTVTVLNRGALSVVCADPPSVYEGSEDFDLDCSASGAPAGSEYDYVWTAQGDTANTLQLSATDISSPTFYVPDEVDETTDYEYLLTASAENMEDATAEVMVTVLNGAPLAFVDDSIASRVYVFTVGESIEDILLPQATGGLSPYTYTLTPALPEGLELDDTTRTISGTPLEVSPRTEYTWQVTDANVETAQIAFFIEVVPAEEPTSVPVAETSSELPEPSSLGVTVSVSSLRFGVQSAGTQVSLDPMTDGISTHVSGPYHAGRMTLSPGGSEETPENGEMNLSIELASPVVLRREGGIEAASIVLAPIWSLAESCEQLSSQAIGGLYTEVTLSEADCRLLRFGGELDLTDVPSGRYMGSLDIILRSGESEETHSVDVEVRVVPAQRVITIGPGGVRFSTSRELPAGLTEEQNLSIYPDVAFLTEEKPNGVFELSNPSLIPLEVSVSTSFGYTEATENGREVVVEDVSESHLGDLSQVVDIHPGVLVLMPGEKGLVRYGMQEGALATMAEKGYAAFFDVVSEPRQYVRLDQMPEEVSGEKTARVTMRVPGVYVPGEGASQLRAALLSISYVGSLSATFLLETQDHPFVGEVLAYDGEGRELGRRETLVYTRSRVRIPLDRVPEGGAVFLRFAPRGSDRVPLPASVEWDAPRRDIGAADKDHTRPPQTLVQKP